MENRSAKFARSVLSSSAVSLRAFPWRKKLGDPYAILVAEVLLKRTTATAAARLYDDFLREFPNLGALVVASEEKLTAAFAQVGLQQQRARAMRALAIHLVEVERGSIPNELGRLLAVPGLGEYSARAVLTFGFDVPVAVVDSNVERILSRVFRDLLPTRPTRRVLQQLADSLLPEESHSVFNFALLDLGAEVCRYVAPRCGTCPLRHMCDYYNSNKRLGIREHRATYETPTGSRVREVRRERGLGLVKLAHESGVSKLTIIRIESGKTTPRDDTLRKLAVVLNVEMEELR